MTKHYLKNENFQDGGWKIRGSGKSYSRPISRTAMDCFKLSGELPKVGALPSYISRISEKSQPVTDAPTPSNLAIFRFYGPIPSAARERELIRAWQAGNRRAGAMLVMSHQRLVRKIAGKFHDAPWEDRIGAGNLGLVEAMARYDLAKTNCLAAYAAHWIAKRIRQAVKDWRTRGKAGETRSDRYVYDNHSASLTAAMVVDRFKAKGVYCSLHDAMAAIQIANGYWHGHEIYDTIEAVDYDKDGKERLPEALAAAACGSEDQELQRERVQQLSKMSRRVYGRRNSIPRSKHQGSNKKSAARA